MQRILPHNELHNGKTLVRDPGDVVASRGPGCQPARVHSPEKLGPIRIRGCGAAGINSLRSGMDSDLEAFSHNPADGSFAALPGQTAAKTNYLNQRFLSY